MNAHRSKRFSGARMAKHTIFPVGALLILVLGHSNGLESMSSGASIKLNGDVFGKQAEASQREQYVELIGSIDSVLSGLGSKAKHLADDTLDYLESGQASDS